MYKIGIKFSSTSPAIKNVKRITTLSIYDDLLSQKIFVIPNYIDGYQVPLQYQHTHFIIYKNEVHTGLLQNDGTVEIHQQSVHKDEIDFITPLLSMIY